METPKPVTTLLVALLLAVPAFAGDETASPPQPPPTGDQATELSKQVQDPLSGLILLPMMYEYASIDVLDRPVEQLLVEPTFPIKINDSWKILTHTVIPIVRLPIASEGRTTSGLSNVMFSALLAKTTQSSFTTGFGAGLLFPTASDTATLTWTHTPTGYDCWAAGPSVVGVFMKGSWVAGVLVNQTWSFAGESDLNMMQIQGFAFYNMSKGFSLGYQPLISIDWQRSADQRTMLPVGLQLDKLTMIGGVFPLGTSVGYYYNAIRPDYAPKSSWRAELYFILPEFW
jgi:hypothetical protein